MAALAEYRTRVLALLNDAALSIYTNAQVDAALRPALARYNALRPLIKTYNLDTDGNGIMELPSDFTMHQIFKVQLQEADIDDYRDIDFQVWYEDESLFLKTTKETIASGEVLIISYYDRHTIDDLDSAAGTTIFPEDEHYLQVGAAGYACMSRVASVAEGNNLEPDATRMLLELGDRYLQFFESHFRQQPASGCAVLDAIADDLF